MHPLEGECFELLSEVPDVGDKAKEQLFPALLSLVVLAVMCELSAALVVLILVFLINLLILWLCNHVDLGDFPERLSPGCSLLVQGLWAPVPVRSGVVVPSPLGCRVCFVGFYQCSSAELLGKACTFGFFL